MSEEATEEGLAEGLAFVAGYRAGLAEPRVWQLPAEPGPEVTRLKDRYGTKWIRCERGNRWEQAAGGNALTRYTFVELLGYVGPLTDATPTPTEETAP